MPADRSGGDPGGSAGASGGHGACGDPGGARHTGAGPGLSPEEGEKGRGAGGQDPLPGPGWWAQPPPDGAGRAVPALA